MVLEGLGPGADQKDDLVPPSGSAIPVRLKYSNAMSDFAFWRCMMCKWYIDTNRFVIQTNFMKETSEPFHNSPAADLANLQTQMLRPGLRATQDGGFELGWAVFMLLSAVGPYLNALLTQARWFSVWTSWIGFLPLLLGAFAPYAVPKLVKRFVTWPRTGYVATSNEPKLTHLVLLMIFGGALGFAITLPFVLVSQIHRALNGGGLGSDLHSIVLNSVKLLICAAVALYLGRKVIRKRQPVQGAYDAKLITESLKQTASGRKHLRIVKGVLVGLHIGLPLLVFGLVFGLMYWNRPAMRYTEFHWSELGLPSFLVATNLALYFMGSGVVLKPNRWKWFLLPAMVLAPVLVAPAIPRPVMPGSMTTMFDTVLPVMLCLGLVWLLSGAATLGLFMRRNPVPSAEAA